MATFVIGNFSQKTNEQYLKATFPNGYTAVTAPNGNTVYVAPLDEGDSTYTIDFQVKK